MNLETSSNQPYDYFKQKNKESGVKEYENMTSISTFTIIINKESSKMYLLVFIYCIFIFFTPLINEIFVDYTYKNKNDGAQSFFYNEVNKTFSKLTF